MTKVTLSTITNISGAESTALAAMNLNSSRIVTAIDNTLSRDGTTPNQMGADIDMNNNDVYNVDNITANTLILGGKTASVVDLTAALSTINLTDAMLPDRLQISHLGTPVTSQAEARSLDKSVNPIIYRTVNGFVQQYQWDATFPSNRYSFDTDQIFYMGNDPTFVAPGAYVAKIRGAINVKEYGVAEGGAVGDAQLSKLLTFAQYATQYQLGASGGQTGSVALRFSSGVYAFDQLHTVTNGFGMQHEGDGMVSSVVLFKTSSASTYMYRLDNTFATSFQNMSIICGAASTTPSGFYVGLPKVDVEQEATQTKRFIDWRGNAAGSNRQIYMDKVRANGWAVFLDVGVYPGYVGADLQHSENFFYGCEFAKNKAVVRLDNTQSVNWSMINCITEFNTTAVWDVVAGGNITMIGGSHINFGDLVRLRPRSNGSGLGNSVYSFKALKFEDGYYYDNTRTPMIIRTLANGTIIDGYTVGDVHAHITMQDCQWLSGTNYVTLGARRTIMDLIGGDMSLTLDNCDMYGDIRLEVPSSWTGPMPKCTIRNCRIKPNIVLINNGGKQWQVEYIDVVGTLAQHNVTRTIDGSLNQTRPMIDVYKNLGTVVVAGDTLFTIDVPVGDTLCQSPKIVFSRVNAVQVDFTFYSDAARTKPIATLNAGASAGEREFYATLVTGNLKSDAVLSNGLIYGKMTCTGGGSGISVLKAKVFTAL